MTAPSNTDLAGTYRDLGLEVVEDGGQLYGIGQLFSTNHSGKGHDEMFVVLRGERVVVDLLIEVEDPARYFQPSARALQLGAAAEAGASGWVKRLINHVRTDLTDRKFDIPGGQLSLQVTQIFREPKTVAAYGESVPQPTAPARVVEHSAAADLATGRF